MQLSLLTETRIYSSVLPAKQKGQYWVTHTNSKGEEERVISVEGLEGSWILKSNRHAVILDSQNRKVREVAVEPMNIYNIKLTRTEEHVVLFAEPLSDDRKVFRKLMLPAEGRLSIGRGEGCDLRYNNPYMSSRHAELILKDGTLSVRDCESANGTFVDGVNVTDKLVSPGDTIYMVGLKIVIGRGYIAVNNPDGQLTYKDGVFKPFLKQEAVSSDEDDDDFGDEDASKQLFYRSPRFKRDIEKKEFKIDPPPSMGNMEQMPLMLMLGPSLTMGMAAMFTGLFTLYNVMYNGGNMMNSMPMLVMSFSMLIGTILWPIMTRRYEGKKRREKEKERQDKYRKYLEQLRREFTNEVEHQREILHENHLPVAHCVNRIRNRERNLWERTHRQNDFLKVRLGIGRLPLSADFRFPEKRFSLDDDVLQEELQQLADEPKVLEQVPISLAMTEDWVSGLIGSRELVTEAAKGLILQLAALHSYDELKMVFLYDPKEQEQWGFVKWLPHVWNNERELRFVANSPAEVKQLSAFFEKEIAVREELTADEDLKDISPHYVIFCASKQLADKAEMVSQILKLKQNFGFSLVHLYDELMNLPKECSLVVEYDEGISKIYDKDDISGSYIAFQPDEYDRRDELDLAIRLANIQLNSSASLYKLPTMMTFLEMFGVGKIEHLNALTRWRDNDPTLSLETPIGIDTNGDIFKLDLHERFHGPHGLIAGMTGSGKSEFIMTFILSLAVNYHPHEVAFILIDYKGGGMANAFSTLPHLAGTITNLDGAAVKRSLISIQSELKRRQSIFSDTSKSLGMSNMDIYQYQKLFREGKVSEPLQHLFIISDEFAELKTQQPEFMEQLVSAARIGRSLGVHLILATQKPSGVVDDQIWSNSRFRICLKVQEKADSMDVIKRPDAASLSVTGRFYVQVGFNELFELGQSGWGGAPYYPTDRLEKNEDDSVAVVDNLGRIVKQVKLDKRKAMFRNPPKQLDEVNKYLASIADEEGITVRSLWLDPIPALIYRDELKQKYAAWQAEPFVLNPLIGEVDDPVNQRQLPMTFPLSQEGNAVIYGSAGSGKTTFLTTLVTAMLEEHTPDEVNFYMLDFASETLRAFEKAPHVGDVLVSHETEKIQNLFKMLLREMDQRKKRFADYGGDFASYRKSSGEAVPAIVLIIHNFSAFTELYEDMEETIALLTREGLKYGIFFVVTALNTGAVRYRILQNFKQLFVLQLNDQSDYSGVLGNVDGVYPSKLKGRGIYKTDRVYEFQLAHLERGSDQPFDAIRRISAKLAAEWGKPGAVRIPILPDRVDSAYLADELGRQSGFRLPVGIEKSSLKVASADFDSAYISLVLSQNNDRADFAQGLAELYAHRGSGTLLVLDPEEQFIEDAAAGYSLVSGTAGLEEAVVGLFQMLVTRNNTYKDAQEAGEPAPVFDKQTCLIVSLSGLLMRISADAQDKLKVLLERGERAYNVQFIICDSAPQISAVAYEAWYKNKVSLDQGIWLGNGITDQYQFKLAKMSGDLYQDIGDDFGYVIHKGRPTLVKLLTSIHYNAEVTEDG
ncbi:type VII secretion protein EssC [Paenibacillus sambharensis]|uniref:Type VII secretion protein EssC n=1 Tax=Paenibacillus sambharensis TaxID=1803190 RepID=A0A2W1L6J6_9BACL|nr:type VII secretion protein EssC [Paenibacillus sambharensis]PZD94583.1 type VII secretion protein EssC [Paenibacillus sambharensis]